MMDANAQKSTIEFLEKALADVRAGKAQGFVGICMGAGGQNMITRSGGPKDTMYMMLGLVQHGLMEETHMAMRGQQAGRPSLVRAGTLPPLPGLNGAN